MSCQINPKYEALKPFVDKVEFYFQRSTQVLYDQRNVIKVVDYEGHKYVVKAFKRPNFINRFAYRYLRPSKAKRSFLYSLRLGETLTPEPIAYIESIKNGLLDNSFYISDFFDFDHTIHEILSDKTINDRVAILQSFANFTFQLHQQKILHHDYSHGNILIKRVTKESSNYEFKIIDVNRMEFKRLTLKMRLANFSRIKADDEDMRIIIDVYAYLMNLSADTLLVDAIFYRDDFYQKRTLKHKLRGKK